MLQLIQLRWIAVVGQIVTILVVHYVFRIELPLAAMAAVIACLIALNLGTLYRRRTLSSVSNGELLSGLLLDVAALTGLLYLSGGASNPFIFLYPLQVTLGAMLLDAWSTWTMVAATSLCFAGLTMFYVPLRVPGGGIAELFQLHILGMLICFVLDAVLLVIFMSRINRILRARDARLADLRQRAAEEDHIVRMGLLASGAAHELGTPLATLSVILGDWRRMAVFRDDPELLQEIGDMQAEVQRCKTIVTGILLSAGEARGESPAVTTVTAFLDELVEDWHETRAPACLQYDKSFTEDREIVSDSALKQIICNVLDNALEVSPQWVALAATQEGETLALTVKDRGPGFAPEMLERFGKPYQSSKGRPGGGLGLFLVVNVVRKLGGRVTADNAPDGGAVVTLYLPLAALSIEDEHVRAA
jgi:two-component system sensor histidine kinase RegB